MTNRLLSETIADANHRLSPSRKFMQKPDRRISLLLSLAFLGLTCACYAHPGKPHDDDPELWKRYAIEACERGDERAYRAFAERADLDEDRDHCGESEELQDNTSVTGD